MGALLYSAKIKELNVSTQYHQYVKAEYSLRCLLKCKGYLSHLEPDDRVKEGRVIHKIITKATMYPPYDQSSSCVNLATTLLTRLSNPKMFFNVLQCLGFTISNDQKKVIFNTTKCPNLQWFKQKALFLNINRIYIPQINIKQHMDTFTRVDNLLALYCKKMGFNKYFDSHNKYGRFLQIIMDEQLIDQDIYIDAYFVLSSWELTIEVVPSHLSVLTSFINNSDIFPSEILKRKQLMSYFLVKYCYENNEIPNTNEIIAMTKDVISTQIVPFEQEIDQKLEALKKHNKKYISHKLKITSVHKEVKSQESNVSCICGEYMLKAYCVICVEKKATLMKHFIIVKLEVSRIIQEGMICVIIVAEFMNVKEWHVVVYLDSQKQCVNITNIMMKMLK
eukprot:335326_1